MILRFVAQKVDPRKCAKQTTVAIIVSGEDIFVGSNWCNSPQEECPRKDLKTGEGYEFCKNVCHQDNHAEIDALRQAGDKAKGATMILFGHYYCCDSCATAIKSSGIRKLVVLGNTKVDLILGEAYGKHT